MKKNGSLAVALLLSLSLLWSPAAAQRPAGQTPPARPAPAPQAQTPQSQPADQDEDEVVRITTNLVQIDAIVTDRDGRQVTDLRPEEFRIFEDGREQKITNFSYVNVAAPNAPQVAANRAVRRGVAPIPSVRLRPEQVRRTIALVVDDLQMSQVSMNWLRKGLKQYVDEQVQPGDLVALIRTRGGMGTLQQFTSDRRQLYAAIDRLRWYPLGSGDLAPLMGTDPIQYAMAHPEPLNPAGGNSEAAAGIDDDRGGIQDINEARTRMFTVGALGALSSVVRGLRDLPGRKAVIFFSDGFELIQFERLIKGTGIVSSTQILDELRDLIDQANRASVVIHTVDSRGLLAFNVGAKTVEPRVGAAEENSNSIWKTQAGMAFLSENTGGLAIRNSNGMTDAIRRVLDDQRGYYLIGYRPDERTFDPAKGREFHKWKVEVRRPGLRVRTRAGFYGRTDEETRTPPAQMTRGQQLVTALSSPFAASGIELRLTSLFGNDPAAGSYMRSLLHLDARALTFNEQPDGIRQAVIDVMAVTLGADGKPVDEVNVTQTLTARGDTYKRLLENGLDYVLNVPVKKPGAYQLRVAVRDAATSRVGSASQFVEVPDLTKSRLALSGIAVSGREASSPAVVQTSATVAPPAPESAGPDAPSGPIVRRLRQGMALDYGLVVYNARLDPQTRQPQLSMQVRLLRDGQIVYEGPARRVDVSGQTDMQRLVVGGSLQTGKQLTPGEYVLQVIVTDALAREKERVATQWIDFEIVG